MSHLQFIDYIAVKIEKTSRGAARRARTTIQLVRLVSILYNEKQRKIHA